MAAPSLVERYAAHIHGEFSCFDRFIIVGTLPGACYAQGMTSFLYQQGIRIFDYAKFAEPLRDRIRARAHQVCREAGIEIEHVSKSYIRKEDLVARVLATRGDAPGLVHVISAMEACRGIGAVLPACSHLGTVQPAVLRSSPQRRKGTKIAKETKAYATLPTHPKGE